MKVAACFSAAGTKLTMRRLQIIVSLVFSHRQYKQSSEGPDAADQAADGPTDYTAPAVIGDDATEDGVEEMHARGGRQQRCRRHVGFDDQQSSEVSNQVIEIHERPLTLCSVS